MANVYKAALLIAPEKIIVGSLPLPELAPGEALVRIKCANLCPTDLKKYHHLDERSSAALLQDGPLVLGHEASGIVTQVGSEVNGIKPGARVAIDPVIPCHECAYCKTGDFPLCLKLTGIGFSAGSIQQSLDLLSKNGIGGCFAEYVKVPAENLYVLPDSMSFEAAALMEPLADVVHSIVVGAPKTGDTAAVFGLGAMGLMHIRLLASMGISKIIGIDPLSDRRAKAAAFGATLTLDPTHIVSATFLRDNTGGVGPHVIFVCAGGSAQKTCTRQALKAIRKKGRILLYASAFKPAEMSIDINQIHYESIKLTGTVGFYRRHAEKALQLLDSGIVDAASIRTPTFPLERINEAFSIYGDTGVVKVGIDIDNDHGTGAGN